MLVSVLLPVYNVAQYVEDAVTSITQQTYTDLEIIIVDDCSSDETFSICKRLAAMDKRIRLFRNTKNEGVAETLNRAYAYSNGSFIARMDGDDISEPDRISRQMEYLDINPEIDLVGVNLIAIGTDGNVINKFEHLYDQDLIERSAQFVTPVSHVWVARRFVYDKLCAYRNIPGCEDYDFLLRMLSSGFKFSNVPNYYGYQVRILRSGNTQSTIGLRQRKMFNYVFQLYKDRRRYGSDCHSAHKMAKYLSSSRFMNRLYQISNWSLYRAIVLFSDRRFVLAFPFIVLSLLSPYQTQYLYYRLRYRILLRSQKRRL